MYVLCYFLIKSLILLKIKLLNIFLYGTLSENIQYILFKNIFLNCQRLLVVNYYLTYKHYFLILSNILFSLFF